jgi:hypothetical protein
MRGVRFSQPSLTRPSSPFFLLSFFMFCIDLRFDILWDLDGAKVPGRGPIGPGGSILPQLELASLLAGWCQEGGQPGRITSMQPGICLLYVLLVSRGLPVFAFLRSELHYKFPGQIGSEPSLKYSSFAVSNVEK